MKSKRRQLKLFSVALLSALSCAFASAFLQREMGGGLSRQSGEVSLDAAIAAADGLLEKLALPAIRKPGVRWRIQQKTLVVRQRVYLIRTECRKHFEVESRTGRLILYHDLARNEDQVKGRLDRSRPRFTTQEAAKAYMINLAARVSGRSDLIVRSFEFKRDGQVRDQNSCGYMGIDLCDPQRRYVLTMSADPLDGVVTLLAQTWRRSN